MTPAEQQAQDCGGNTGPYRRVWSTPGFSWMSATVYLPSKATVPPEVGIGAAQVGDTCFVYAGGWGSAGQAVDAGFQYSNTYDNWALFLKYQGLPEKVLSPDIRFLGGSSVQLTFEIPNDDELLLTATGQRNDGQSGPLSLHLSAADGVGGWSAAGGAQILKRMTSIGQNVQSFSTGSFLTNVEWSTVQIGTSAANAIPWLSAQTGGQCMYPNDGTTVTVNFVTEAQETDNIRL